MKAKRDRPETIEVGADGWLRVKPHRYIVTKRIEHDEKLVLPVAEVDSVDLEQRSRS